MISVKEFFQFRSKFENYISTLDSISSELNDIAMELPEFIDYQLDAVLVFAKASAKGFDETSDVNKFYKRLKCVEVVTMILMTHAHDEFEFEIINTIYLTVKNFKEIFERTFND